MAYTPTKWQDHIPEVQDGTPVSAVNMNKIEEGSCRHTRLQTALQAHWITPIIRCFHITPQGRQATARAQSITRLMPNHRRLPAARQR